MRTEHAAHDSELPEEVIPEHGPRDGCLSPWADPVTATLGWQVTTASRRLAATVAAISGGKAKPHEKGQWQARIPEAALTVLLTGADSGALWCRLGRLPILAFSSSPSRHGRQLPYSNAP